MRVDLVSLLFFSSFSSSSTTRTVFKHTNAVYSTHFHCAFGCHTLSTLMCLSPNHSASVVPSSSTARESSKHTNAVYFAPFHCAFGCHTLSPWLYLSPDHSASSGSCIINCYNTVFKHTNAVYSTRCY